jgi:eukaryotic-like serine/threonine-protein kinase
MAEHGHRSVDWDTPLAQRYQLDVLLGSGSMADVYRAEDVRLRRPVAVKIFRDPGPDARRRFVQEARILANWTHPGLVSVFDAGIDGERLYLVMQLVQGESLRSRLRTGPLQPAEVIRLGISLADAIDHVHSHGIAHLDVKPANVLLDTEGNTFLADCGVALLATSVELSTAAQTTRGPAYLAPEQVHGGDVTPAVDIYALGTLLFECLTGQPPDPGRSRARSALARLSRRPRTARLVRLLAAMRTADADRRPSPGHCADALRMLDPTTPMAELPTLVTPPATPPRQQPGHGPGPGKPISPAHRATAMKRAGRLRTRLLVHQPAEAQPASTSPPRVRHARRGRSFLVGVAFVVAVLVGLALMLMLGV